MSRHNISHETLIKAPIDQVWKGLIAINDWEWNRWAKLKAALIWGLGVLDFSSTQCIDAGPEDVNRDYCLITKLLNACIVHSITKAFSNLMRSVVGFLEVLLRRM